MNEFEYIQEHIIEFASFINTTTIERIISEMNLSDSIYTVKYMIITSSGGHLEGFNILILRHFLLVGVITIKNKIITHKNSSMDGLNIKDYLPRRVDNGKGNENRPSSIKKDSLFTSLDIPYDNKLTTSEKLDILQLFNDSKIKPQPIKKEKKIAKKQKGKSSTYDETINNPLVNKGYDWIRHLSSTVKNKE